ncbi:hypothetical protein [Bradyrhizobium sp. LMG 9283]|uniref:hypothetical protein n=1 Tax=Bradyrhizobium sp. LMG 9283 TaxID=592064 RepID=UPI00388FF0DE
MSVRKLEFPSESSCADHLLSRMPQDLIPKDIASAFAHDLAARFKQPPPEAPDGAFSIIVERWIIRDDDLKAFEELVRAATAAAGASFFLDHTKAAAAVVGIAVAVFSIIRNAIRSGAVLASDEIAVVWKLNSARPLRPSAADLASALKDRTRANGSDWTEEDARQVLERLEKYPTKSGLKKFAAKDAAGGWGLEGV